MPSLLELNKKYSSDAVNGGTDKDTWHTYLEFYESEFNRFLWKGITFLELGICAGYSLLLWKDYFVNAQIHGADLRIPDMLKSVDNIHCHHVDCANSTALDAEFSGLKFDIIIDDASHILSHQLISFDTLYPKLNTGGLYVIEDVLPGVIEHFVGRAWRMELYDFRNIKCRGDDMLLVFRKY